MEQRRKPGACPYAEAKCSYNKQFIAAQKLDDPSMHKLATSWIFNQPSSHKSIVKAEFEITQSYQRLNFNFFQSFTCNSDKNRLISPEEWNSNSCVVNHMQTNVTEKIISLFHVLKHHKKPSSRRQKLIYLLTLPYKYYQVPKFTQTLRLLEGPRVIWSWGSE